MFDLYTEKARTAIFFARYEASAFGSTTIDPEHLLLGVLREDKSLSQQIVGKHSVVESIRQEVEKHSPVRVKTSFFIDMPIGEDAKSVLCSAANEAELMHAKSVEPVHLLLGILREQKCFAAQILIQRGITLDQVRRSLDGDVAG